NISQNQIRFEQPDLLQSFVRVAGLAANGHVRLVGNQLSQPLPHHGMVVHNEKADRGGAGRFGGFHWVVRLARFWRKQRTLVPPSARACTSSAAPMIPARYCMVRKPMPAPDGRAVLKPIPLSPMARRLWPLVSVRLIWTTLALPCLMALVTASWAMR